MTDVAASRLRASLWVAAALAAFASLAFAFASPAHVEDGWEYRGFFLAVAVAEMALAVGLTVWSWRSAPLSGRELRFARGAVELGAIVAAAGVLVYVATWVTGAGHEGHSPETIAAGPAVLDIVTKVAEVALVVALMRVTTLMPRDGASVTSRA
jgi:hypothetical protein